MNTVEKFKQLIMIDNQRQNIQKEADRPERDADRQRDRDSGHSSKPDYEWM